MAKDIIGDACAFIKGTNGQKNRYLKMGVAMRDTENGSISLKLDTLPIPGCGWDGWVNVFAQERTASPAPAPRRPVPSATDPFFDDDIPF